MSARVDRYRLTRLHVVLDFPARPGQTVAIRVTTYAPPDEELSDTAPVLSLPFHTEYTREEWEQIKRLGDEAWDAYANAVREQGGRFA